MGVPVPVGGSYTSGYTSHIVRVEQPRPNQPPVKTYDAWLLAATQSWGAVSKATSPVIMVQGQRWSLSHPYKRSAAKLESLDGKLRRSKFVTVAGKPAEIYAEISHAVPSRAGTIDGITAWKLTSPYCLDIGGALKPIDSNLKNRLITELLLKAGKRQVNLGEFFGESRETVKLLAHSVSRISKVVLALSRGEFRKIPGILGVKPKKSRRLTASEWWLEYQFGWMPLLSDIHDLYNTFQKGLSRPHLIRAVRQVKGPEFNYSGRSGNGTVTNGDVVDGKSKSSARAVGFWTLDNQYLDMLQRVGLINPLEVAWALQPYSFVLDWLLPVQNVLEATTATVGLKFVDGSYVYRVSSDVLYGFENHSQMGPMAGSTFKPTWSWMYRYRQHSIERTVLHSSDLIPMLYYKDPFSSSHVTSALALLHQLKR